MVVEATIIRIKYIRQMTNGRDGYRLADMSHNTTCCSVVYKSSGVFDQTTGSCVNLTYRTNLNAFTMW